ncbi:Uncharacterized protein BP5553_08989 [Venustampulla echinocandica]|uniref:Uncharacterized protein n=1 Tax=Venustampulla echinocandica TaxID=2656787 RepID=A0A370TDI7_9HELO|nr:Uncharacterized protein BP5553_08989 [Venustampulla echinocandica]RDL32533.1 Uncharacterized protein BP5553_08989 [Venustampulla echinocandica]
MAPPPPPTAVDHFVAQSQTPILMSAFGLQVLHYQYIRRTQAAWDVLPASSRAISFLPRTLRAGLGWGVVFVGLLTQITSAKNAIRDYTDPVVTRPLQSRAWGRGTIEETT